MLLSVSTHAQAGTWYQADDMNTTRVNFTMTLLQDGRVVVIGGTTVYGSHTYPPRCEIYDPATNQWQATYGNMNEPRTLHTATLLPNNKILVVGGINDSGALIGVEIYDVDTDTWTEVASMNYARYGHTATRMLNSNQEILVVGGSNSINTFEVYDPVDNTWTAGTMTVNRNGHTATLIPNGQVLVCGGAGQTSCQIFTPNINTWTDTASLNIGRTMHTATMMPDNRILVTGGDNPGFDEEPTAEVLDIYNQGAGWVYASSFMNNSRDDGHTAALLPDGSVLIAGSDGFATATSEVFDPTSNTFGEVTSLIDGRNNGFTMTLLQSGNVLIAGGVGAGGYELEKAEIYHWATATIMPTNSLLQSCRNHTATLLPDGSVLVVGGEVPIGGSYFGTHAELYDPDTGNWIPRAAPFLPRARHTATLLKNGRVLVTGGENGIETLNSAELYTPAINQWHMTSSMNYARIGHTATMLLGGRILIAGGIYGVGGVTAEIYDPDLNSWAATSDMNEPRFEHAAVLLGNGTVLVTGGYDINGAETHYSEIYDPETDTWRYTAEPMNFGHTDHGAALLPNGQVLVMGGMSAPPFICDHCSEMYDPDLDRWIAGPNTQLNHASTSGNPLLLLKNGTVLTESGGTEFYDPKINQWLLNTASMIYSYWNHTITLLLDGRVLLAGGWDGIDNRGCEIYDPGLSFDSPWRPNLFTVPDTSVLEFPIEITGGGFYAKTEASGGTTKNTATNHPLVQLRSFGNGQTKFLQQEEVDTFSNAFNSLPLMDFPEGHAMMTVFTNGIPSKSLVTMVNKYPSVLSIDRLDANPTTTGTVRFGVTFDDGNLGIGTDDIVINQVGNLTNADITSITGGFKTYEVTVSGYQGEGTLGITIVDNDTILDYYSTPLGGPGAGNGDLTDGEVYLVDMVVPKLASTTVLSDGLSIEVIYSESMGTGVTDPTIYTISGDGRGTLANNPDSVSHLYGNIYLLSWATGEMANGQDVSITAVDVQDLVGNLIGLDNQASDPDGGIGTAPTTAIDNNEGTYDSFVSVTLSCTDIGDSGCANTFYSIDGSTPTTVYTDPIAITQNTTLRYYSVDAAGNPEGIKTDIYSIDIPSDITCDPIPDTVIFGQGFSIEGAISPQPNQANQGVGVELIPPVGDPILLSTDAAADGTFSLTVNCHVLTSAGDWSVETSWTGDASHLGADSGPILLTVTQAVTSLTLDVVASESIKVNSRPPIGGDFSPTPACISMDLSTTPITVFAAEPDGGPIHTLSAVTNQYGQFLLNYNTAEGGQPFDFDVVGEWTLSAEYAATDEYSGSTAADISIQVVPTAGYAIIVQGRVQSGEGMPSHHKTASSVYDILKNRQLLDDDIQYLSWLFSDGWDGDPSKANIQDAVNVWARDKMDPDFAHPVPEMDTQGQAGDLYIIMINHGWTDPLDDEEGIFYIYPDDPLTSTELGTWVDELQDNLAETVSADRNIYLILGFCRAGAFMEDLAGSQRVVIASAAKDESSHRGPQDVDENGQPLRDGEYFISEFFKNVSYGKSVKQCFEEATLLTEAFTSSGSAKTNAPYFDDSIQHPLLNDNGDGLGSNALSSEFGEDGALSEYLFIGASPPEGNDPGDVLITQVNPAQFLGIQDTSVDLWAEVDDPNDLRLIWVEVKLPNYNPEDPGAELQIEMDNYKKATTDVAGVRYAWTGLGDSPDPFDLFDTPGTYQILYFAKDDDSGHVSPLIQSRVYKALEGNNPPNAFNLLAPVHDASVLTTTILDWEDASDPDFDVLAYTVILSKDDDQFTDPIRIEGLVNSAYLVGPEDGIQDLSTYYWKVHAIDPYGSLLESAVRRFHTDDTNQAFGWIMGYVTSSIDNAPVAFATVEFDVQTLSTDASGYYISARQPGFYDLQVTAAGFETFGPNEVRITEGGILEKNIVMAPTSVDTDPEASIISPASDVSILASGSVNFQGSVTGGNLPFSFVWDFDGGATNSTDEDPGNVTFLTEGIYDVTFMVLDEDDDTGMDTVTVTVTLSDDCPDDPGKTLPGICGCGVADIDTDDDTLMDCNDPDDDNDGITDEEDDFPLDDGESVDTDADGTGDNADPDDDNDAIIDAIEAAGPNNGDANNDGTPDSLQRHVVCLAAHNIQAYVVLETPQGTYLSDCQASANPSIDDAPADLTFDYGFFDFTINGLTPGGITKLTITLPDGVTPDTYYKYGQTPDNPMDHWYEFVYDGTTGAETNANVITLHFVDALQGDDILTPDSLVIDLGAPAFTIGGGDDDDDDDGGGGGGGCFVRTLQLN